MKNIIPSRPLLLFILSTVLCAAGCKKNTAEAKQNLVGKWPLYYQHIIVYNTNGSINNEYTTPYTGRQYLEFFNDGHAFAYYEDTDQKSARYTYTPGSNKIIVYEGNVSDTFLITKFTATELELSNRDVSTFWVGKMKK